MLETGGTRGLLVCGSYSNLRANEIELTSTAKAPWQERRKSRCVKHGRAAEKNFPVSLELSYSDYLTLLWNLNAVKSSLLSVC